MKGIGCTMTLRAVAIALCALVSVSAAQATFYVSPSGSDVTGDGSFGSPWATITKARDAVRAINGNMTDDIEVILRGGTYSISNTIAFTNSDNGANGHYVIYRAYDGEAPAISGGRTVTGWIRATEYTNNIYKAKANVNDTIMQFYINGVMMSRATLGNGTVTTTSNGFTANQWVAKAPGAVYVLRPHLWLYNYCVAQSVSGDDVTMHQPGWSYGRCDQIVDIYNVRGAVDNVQWNGQGGVWEAFNDTVWYWARSGEDMSSVTAEVAGSIQTLVSLTGTSTSNPVRNIRFEGITFKLCNYKKPRSAFGFMCTQAGQSYGLYTPGNSHSPEAPLASVALDAASNIVIDGCTFQQLSGDGVNMMNGTRNCRINRSTFREIAAAAIQIGLVDERGEAAHPPDDNAILKNDTISNCTIRGCGKQLVGSIGIMLGFPNAVVIVHNEISNMPYTGISIGWGWGRSDATPTPNKNNYIAYNKIHDIMTTLRDGGAIYTLGDMSGSVFEHNYLYNLGNSHAAMYADEASAYQIWRHNVCKVANGTGEGNYFSNWTETCHDNLVTDNYADRNTVKNNAINTTITNTTIVTNDNWPQEALDIMNNAGPVGEDATPNVLPGRAVQSAAKLHVRSMREKGFVFDNHTGHIAQVRLFDCSGRLVASRDVPVHSSVSIGGGDRLRSGAYQAVVLAAAAPGGGRVVARSQLAEPCAIPVDHEDFPVLAVVEYQAHAVGGERRESQVSVSRRKIGIDGNLTVYSVSRVQPHDVCIEVRNKRIVLLLPAAYPGDFGIVASAEKCSELLNEGLR